MTKDWKHLTRALWVCLDDDGSLLLSDREPAAHHGTTDVVSIEEADIEHLVDYLTVTLGIEPKNAINLATLKNEHREILRRVQSLESHAEAIADVQRLHRELAREIRGAEGGEPSLSSRIEILAGSLEGVTGYVYGMSDDDGLRQMLATATDLIAGLSTQLEETTRLVAELQERVVKAPAPTIPDDVATRDWVERRLSTVANVLRTYAQSLLLAKQPGLLQRVWKAVREQPAIANADGRRAAGFTPEQAQALGAQAASSYERARKEG